MQNLAVGHAEVHCPYQVVNFVNRKINLNVIISLGRKIIEIQYFFLVDRHCLGTSCDLESISSSYI